MAAENENSVIVGVEIMVRSNNGSKSRDVSFLLKGQTRYDNCERKNMSSNASMPAGVNSQQYTLTAARAQYLLG